MDVLLSSRVVIAPSFRLRPRAQLSSGRLLRCGPSRTRAAGQYRVGEDGALGDAACQHRRTRVGERSCNLASIDLVHAAAVENDPDTELRPKRVRFVDDPERLGKTRTDERRQLNSYEH